MTSLLSPMLSELREEAAITKRVLERVPVDRLSWRPHPKSMSLGQLALHVLGIPGNLAKLVELEEFEAARANFEPAVPADLREIPLAFDQSIRTAEECLGSMNDQKALGTWRLTIHGKEALAKPRVDVLRSVMLNHWYHHRGQLSVYLRLLEVAVPVIYGRSADENPFA